MLALSIRQPWAWLILRPDLKTAAEREGARLRGEIKPVENRTWRTSHRGPLLIHAAKTMTAGDYEACAIFIASFSDIVLPAPEKLKRGGVVGRVELVDCVEEMDSFWFVGDYGWVVQTPEPLPFYPCRGQQFLFPVDYPFSGLQPSIANPSSPGSPARLISPSFNAEHLGNNMQAGKLSTKPL